MANAVSLVALAKVVVGMALLGPRGLLSQTGPAHLSIRMTIAGAAAIDVNRRRSVRAANVFVHLLVKHADLLVARRDNSAATALA